MEQKYLEILKKSTILLVDDNSNLRDKFKEALFIYVDNVYEASNGVEALEIYHKLNPTIIITDVKMPIMDGLMLTTVIRKLNPNIPIVVISAYSDKPILLNFMSLNLIEYLIKPIDFEQLSNVLENCSKIIMERGLLEVKLTLNTIYSYSKKSLIVNDKLITLTPKEVLFLELLLKNTNSLVTKETVENIVYYGEDMSTPAINNLILKLRKKIGSNTIIATISTFGFMLVNKS